MNRNGLLINGNKLHMALYDLIMAIPDEAAKTPKLFQALMNANHAIKDWKSLIADLPSAPKKEGE